MTVLQFHEMPPQYAAALLENQKGYTAPQAAMAKAHPHLVWVLPPRRPLPREVRIAVYERDKGSCAYCGIYLAEDEFTVDHIIARVRGGGDDLENLTVACRSCNSQKGTRTPEELGL